MPLGRSGLLLLPLLLLAACGPSGPTTPEPAPSTPPGPGTTSAYGIARLINRRTSPVTRLVVQSESDAANGVDLSFPTPMGQGEFALVALRVGTAPGTFAVHRVEYADGLVVAGGGPGANHSPFLLEPARLRELSLPPAPAEATDLLEVAAGVVRLTNPTAVTVHRVVLRQPAEGRVALLEPTGGWRPGGSFAFPFAAGAWVLDSLELGGLATTRADAPVVFTAEPGRDHDATLPGFVPDDPLHALQWHLTNPDAAYAGLPGRDANVLGAWASGLTGAGVPIAIVDDGLEIAHADLAAATTPMSVWHRDYQQAEGPPNADPTAAEHGTSVAGVAGARGGNGLGVTGVAPGALLAGLRVLGAPLSTVDLLDAFTLGAGYVHNDSWGPADPDSYVPPSVLPGIDVGLTQRGGLGVVYVMAAGNDRARGGNANLAGDHQHRGLILVAATQPDGVVAGYSNPGANLWVSAPASGLGRGTTTTDRSGDTRPAGYNPRADGSTDLSDLDYTSSFGGTSSATPVVSGVVALMLQANPGLSWRDVRAILARTAQKNDSGKPGWITNGAGLHFHHDHGFGGVDASAAVAAARAWASLPAERFATVTVAVNQAVPDADTNGVTSTVNFPNDGSWPAHIEHVEVQLDFSHGHTYARDLAITLTSPAGTVARLAVQGGDVYDHSATLLPESGDTRGASTLVLGATCFLDEPAVTAVSGQWTLRVVDAAFGDVGTLAQWTIRIWGHD